MAVCRRLMADAAMTTDSLAPPDWPQPDDYGTTDDAWASEVLDVVEPYRRYSPATAAVQAYDHAYLAHRRDGGGAAGPGIPAHKLSSHDGWIITPAEIGQALQLAPDAVWRLDDPAADPTPVPFARWGPWLSFLRQATRHGGIEVH